MHGEKIGRLRIFSYIVASFFSHPTLIHEWADCSLVLEKVTRTCQGQACRDGHVAAEHWTWSSPIVIDGHMAAEHLECACCQLSCAVPIRYTLNLRVI